MGKEAKIGLGVILILLIVFGVVLARRLNGPSDGSAAAAPDERAVPAGHKHDNAAGTHHGEGTATGSGTRPTVVEAKAGSARSGSQSSPAEIGQWNVVSDSGTSRHGTASARPRSAPPSFMPSRPANEASSSPYRNPYRTAQPADKTAGAWPGEPATAAAPGAAGHPQDPLQQQPARTPGDFREAYGHGHRPLGGYDPPGQLNPAQQSDVYKASDPSAPAPPNPLRGQTGTTATSPAENAGASRDSAGYGPPAYRIGGRGQHSQEGAAVQRTPAYTAGATSTYRTMPKPTHTATQYGTAASVTAQYGPEDYRRPDGTYVVQPNDSYWVISEKLYGTGAYFKALAEHNRKKHPEADKLKVGDVIAAPTKAELVQTYGDLCPTDKHAEAAKRQAIAVSTRGQYAGGKTYVVQAGDTLYDIAHWELGKAARWGEIYELNRDILGEDFDHLTPGVKLILPSDEPTDTVTRRNGTYYQR